MSSQTKDKASEPPPALNPYAVGRTGTLVDFIQGDCAAKTEFLAVQTARQAEMKKPSAINQWLTGSQQRKNEALEEIIQSAAQITERMRKPLHAGARAAFLLDDQPEKVQLLLSEPEKFMPIGFKLLSPEKMENKFVADTLISLINESTDPDAVPALALEKVEEEKKTSLLSSALQELITTHWDKDFEKVAATLLQAGAKANSAVLAAAIHRKLPYTVVTMLLDQGASLDEARTILTKKKSDSLDKLTFIERDCTQRAIIKGMAENIRDLTGVTEGRHRQPEPVAKHRKPHGAQQL